MPQFGPLYKLCKGLIRLTNAVLNLYLPGWFKFKSNPHIQDGARNYFFLVELSRKLVQPDKNIALKVLQDISYWAHSENIIISMLSDVREEIRRKAVLRIMKARREFNEDTHPRQFIPPIVNFEALNYFDLIDWDVEPCTEPHLTVDIDLDNILRVFNDPLSLPPFPNHTQAVERMVRVVTEVATKRVGFTGRHRLILQMLDSRNKVPTFNTKNDDANF